MTTGSASDSQQQWALVVRRSFGIADVVGTTEARNALVASLQDKLQASGWQSATRAVAEPMVDALMVLGAGDDLENFLLPPDAAYRLIETGLAEVDPEHLAHDVRFEYPSEIVGVARQVVEQITKYMREQSSSY